MELIISGCHSGPNPSPGLGIAKCVRQAFPDIRLIAKDHANDASGIHDPVFDDRWICRPWEELNLKNHVVQIASRLTGNSSWYLSGLDVECRLLGVEKFQRYLGPSEGSIDSISKPEISAAKWLPFHVPPFVLVKETAQSVLEFCQSRGWAVLVKGGSYEAFSVRSWPHLQSVVEQLYSTWGDDTVFVQEIIHGDEICIAFAAFEGHLIDAVLLEKRTKTTEGKTWAGQINDVPSHILMNLRLAVERLGWTGGCELELIRDVHEKLWVIDWNPRFPAWIYGAAIAGRNLPAMLLANASGLSSQPSPLLSRQFIRVVTEIAVRADTPLPLPRQRAHGESTATKHASGMAALRKRLPRKQSSAETPTILVCPSTTEIDEAFLSQEKTPFRVLFQETADHRFSKFAEIADQLGKEFPLQIRLAYSMKTNPHSKLIELALKYHYQIEVISAHEHQQAVLHGCMPSSVVHNGPYLPAAGQRPLRVGAVFADSIGALSELPNRFDSDVYGVRIRPPCYESRFGVDVGDPSVFRELLHSVRMLPAEVRFGVSLHLQSSDVGFKSWIDHVQSVAEVSRAVESLTGRSIDILNLGGGFCASWLDTGIADVLKRVLFEIPTALPKLKELLLEPGKMIVEPCAAIVAEVLEIRERGDARDVVVDAGISDIPLVNYFPHRFIVTSEAGPRQLCQGEDRILGRLCMEADILNNGISLPQSIAPGDRLIVLDCGAYDTSMSYEFGRGETS